MQSLMTASTQIQDFAKSKIGDNPNLGWVSGSPVVGARRAVPLLDSLYPSPRYKDWSKFIAGFFPNHRHPGLCAHSNCVAIIDPESAANPVVQTHRNIILLSKI